MKKAPTDIDFIDGLYLFERIEHYASGFLVAMYGSVLKKGHGKDLDLLFIPWRPYYSIAETERTIRTLLEFKGTGIAYEGLMESETYQWETPNGKIIDAQFRHAKVREPKELSLKQLERSVDVQPE